MSDFTKEITKTLLNGGNSRNGTYERTIKSEFGGFVDEIPRDHNGDFKNQTLEPYRRHDDT